MARGISLDEALADDSDNAGTSTAKPAERPALRTVSVPRNKGGRRRPTNPVKLTIELDPEQHRKLKTFALLQAEDASLAEVIRAAINVLDAHPRLAKAVIDEAAKMKRQRRE